MPGPPGPRRAVARPPLDRRTVLLLALTAGAAAGAGLYGTLSDWSSWRFDAMRALDRCGLYLYLAGPVYTGTAAWMVQRHRRQLGGLVHGLPEPSLVTRSAWAPVAAVAIGIQAVTDAVDLGAARISGAVGPLDLRLAAVQFLAAAAFCALGHLVGRLGRSPAVAPVAVVVLLGLNTLLAQTGFRRFTQVGQGMADFTDLRYATGYLLPKAVLYLTLVLMALPVRTGRLPARARTALAAALAVLAVGSAGAVWTYGGPMLVEDPAPRTCSGTAPRVCVPSYLAGHREQITTDVAAAVSALRAAGVTGDVPDIGVISRAAITVPDGQAGLLLSGATLAHDGELRREIARALSSAQMCDDLTATSGPSDAVLLDRATLDGWLQVHTGSVEAGSYPTDRVAALDALDDARRATELQALFTRVWTCSGTGAA